MAKQSPKVPEWIRRGASVAVSNWQLVLAGVTAVLTGGWSYFSQHGYVETALLGLWTFVGVLLSIGGVLWLRDRREPREMRVAHDLPYGLAYQGLNAIADPSQDDWFFQLGIVLQNVSAHTLEALFTRFDVVVGSRTLAGVAFEHKPLIVPRHSVRTYRSPPFPKSDLTEYFGKNTTGVAEFWINYGPTGEAKTRCLHIKLDLYMRIDLVGGVGISEVIVLEKDSEVIDE